MPVTWKSSLVMNNQLWRIRPLMNKLGLKSSLIKLKDEKSKKTSGEHWCGMAFWSNTGEKALTGSSEATIINK